MSEVEGQIKPGTSALFVLDQAGDMDAILQEDSGPGWDDAEDQCRSGAGKADSGHPGCQRPTTPKLTRSPGQRLDGKTENPP